MLTPRGSCRQRVGFGPFYVLTRFSISTGPILQIASVSGWNIRHTELIDVAWPAALRATSSDTDDETTILKAEEMPLHGVVGLLGLLRKANLRRPANAIFVGPVR